MLLEQKRVLITGAGSGIGRALAVEAARRGSKVALCGRRVEMLEETASLFVGAEPVIIPADITMPHDRDRITKVIGDAWGTLDVLVNNAGVVPSGDLIATNDATLNAIFSTNVVGALALTRNLIPLLTGGSRSRVVNIGSVFGDIPFPGFAAYSASKAAIKAFSIALRREVRCMGIEVTYVAPRATNTAAAALGGQETKHTAKLDSPEYVAKLTWDAVEIGSNTAYAKGPERLYVLLQSILPRMVDAALSRT